MRQARSVVLQTLGHFALDHSDTRDFGDYLRQRIESNYFAAAVLAPEGPAVEFLREADAAEDISVEDLKEVFYISYEMATHRFTNLATQHLEIRATSCEPTAKSSTRPTRTTGWRSPRRSMAATKVSGFHASGVRAKPGTPPAASYCIRSTR